MITSTAFAGKRYAVLGLARSGQATVAALLASGAEVTAWDSREEPRAALFAGHEAEAMAGQLSAADPCAIDLAGYAAVVVSPGVPINRHPVADAARAAAVPMICDIELFAQARADLPPHRVVGITGTNGKSTTTALVHHLLVTGGVPALMGGNIGLPILSEAPLPANAQSRGVYVLELSSFQIDLTLRLDCDVAILLNLSPDHLDRYEGYAAYIDAKARVFGMQAPSTPDQPRLAIVDYHAEMDEDVMRYAPEGQPFLFIDGVNIPGNQADWPSLHGPHNRANAAAAVAAVRYLGVSEAAIEAGLKSFRGLPHRMEVIAEANGVLFVNDSKATNPASAAPALAAFPPDTIATHALDHARAFTGSWGGCPRATISMNAYPIFPMSPPLIRSAMPGSFFARSWTRSCRCSAAKCWSRRSAKPWRRHSRAMSSCCRQPAPASTSSAIMKRAGLPFARSSRRCSKVALPGVNRPILNRPILSKG